MARGAGWAQHFGGVKIRLGFKLGISGSSLSRLGSTRGWADYRTTRRSLKRLGKLLGLNRK